MPAKPMQKGLLTEQLIPRLEARYPGRGLIINRAADHKNCEPFATFPGVVPDFGDLQLIDDTEEVTILAGNFTHGHFDWFDPNQSDADKLEHIWKRVSNFLDETFADKMVFWRNANGGMGGWHPIGRGDEVDKAHATERYVWSGPLKGS